MRVLRLSWLTWAIVLSNCQCGTNAHVDTYSCVTTTDCASGFECVSGRCVEGGSGGGAGTGGGSSAGGGSGGGTSGTGGGSSAGGGGGTSANGGGVTATGGGSSASGGGSAATGGGSSATGGGSNATGGGGSSATGGGSSAMGGGTSATGGGSNATGGGSSATGGGAPTDAGCVPSVVVGAGPAQTTVLIHDSLIRVIYLVGGNGPTAASLVYAECTANCDTPSPSFSTLTLPSFGIGPPRSISLVSRPQGGVVGAALSQNSAGTNRNVYYLECAASCLTGSNWFFTRVASDIDDVRPTIGANGNSRGIAYADHNDTLYAECANGCGVDTNWVSGTVNSAHAQLWTGFALIDAGTTLYREVAIDQGSVFICTHNCDTQANWTSSSAGIGSSTSWLAFLGAPTPMVAGSSSGNLRFNSCDAPPCQMAINGWGMPPSLPNDGASLGAIDLDVSPSGTPVVLYADKSAQLRQTMPDAGAMWVSKVVTACGTALLGAMPQQVLEDDGGVSIVFTTQTEVRYHAR